MFTLRCGTYTYKSLMPTFHPMSLNQKKLKFNLVNDAMFADDLWKFIEILETLTC